MRIAAVVAAGLTLANCAKTNFGGIDPKYGVAASPRVIAFGQPVPKGGGRYSVGRPYVVAGRTYVPTEDPHYKAVGMASWYGDDFHGRRTANGEIFDMNSISAASPVLPLPSYVRVTNLQNHRSLIVRVNDRGPYHGDRVIDVSGRAAQLLDFRNNGLAHVKVEYVGRAPLQGSDDRQLVATLRQDGGPAPAPAPSLVRVAAVGPFLPSERKYSVDPDESLRGTRVEVPLPPSRPYRLGEANDQEQSASAPEQKSEAPPTSHRNVALYQPARPTRSDVFTPPARASVSAFAPARYDGTAALTSGRGLY
jgi:rare lipoprotein A